MFCYCPGNFLKILFIIITIFTTYVLCEEFFTISLDSVSVSFRFFKLFYTAEQTCTQSGPAEQSSLVGIFSNPHSLQFQSSTARPVSRGKMQKLHPIGGGDFLKLCRLGIQYTCLGADNKKVDRMFGMLRIIC